MLASELFNTELVFRMGLKTAAPIGRAILAPNCGKSLKKEKIAALQEKEREKQKISVHSEATSMLSSCWCQSTRES